MSEKIRLLIVEDSKSLAESLRTFMSAQPEIEVVGVAENAEVALQLVQEQQPAALITDLAGDGGSHLPGAGAWGEVLYGQALQHGSGL